MVALVTTLQCMLDPDIAVLPGVTQRYPALPANITLQLSTQANSLSISFHLVAALKRKQSNQIHQNLL